MQTKKYICKHGHPQKNSRGGGAYLEINDNTMNFTYLFNFFRLLSHYKYTIHTSPSSSISLCQNFKIAFKALHENTILHFLKAIEFINR